MGPKSATLPRARAARRPTDPARRRPDPPELPGRLSHQPDRQIRRTAHPAIQTGTRLGKGQRPLAFTTFMRDAIPESITDRVAIGEKAVRRNRSQADDVRRVEAGRPGLTM